MQIPDLRMSSELPSFLEREAHPTTPGFFILIYRGRYIKAFF